jgi:guanylate kinase
MPLPNRTWQKNNRDTNFKDNGRMPSGAIKKGLIFVFSAPSGAGKTTLLNYLYDTVPNLVYSISVTTRSPRTGEVDGLHYFFTGEKDFKCRIKRNEFAEWAVVYGHYYGTPRKFIDSTVAAGKHIIMDIDVEGKKKFDAFYPEAVGILILPPGLDVLERRLRERKSDDEQTIRLRIANAAKEIAFAQTRGKYEYTIINDDLEKAKRETVRLVESLIEK